MTDCSNVDVRELLPDLLHERLDAASRAMAQAHVASCETCAAELQLLRQARRAMHRAPTVDVARIVAALPPAPRAQPADAAPALRIARGRGGPGAARPAVPPAWRRYALAAGLLLAAGLSGVTWLRPTGSDIGAVGGLDIARTPALAVPSATTAEKEPLLAVNVEGLSDADFAGLLDGLADLEAVPAADPAPVVRVERDGSGGD